MWSPNRFPQNLLFLITITRSPRHSKLTTTGQHGRRRCASREYDSHPHHRRAACAADQPAHLQHADGREDPGDGQPALGDDLVD